MASERKLKIIIDQQGSADAGLSSLTKGLGALGGVGATIATGGLALAAGGIVALGAGLFTSVGAASDAQLGQAELAAVLESTRGVAGMTADAINGLASEFQAITPFEDDVVLAGENMLLTFTNIGKDVFPMATEAMLNMGQKFGSVDQAAVMLGKALNDPVAGVTALRRVGVALTEQQEAAIKGFMDVGDIASAQKVILAELETEFGGLAEAAGNTLPGKMAILQHTFGDIQETIGAAFLPALSSVADQLAAGLQSPQAQAALSAMTGFITDSVVPAIGQIMAFVGDATTLFLDWSSTLSETTGPAMVMIKDALDRINVATGGAMGKFSLSKTLLGLLKITLDAVTTAIKLVALGFQGAAWAVEKVSAAVRIAMDLGRQIATIYTTSMNSIKSGINAVIGKWNDFKAAVRSAVDAIPDWLVPGSPTPFEIGLRGIAGAAGQVAGQLPGAFAAGVGGQGLEAGVGVGGGGGAQIIVNLTFAPVVSLADRDTAQRQLLPLIIEGIKQAQAQRRI